MSPSSPRGTKISHIGIAVRALGDSAPLFEKILGLSEVPLANSDGARIRGFDAAGSLIELLEASDDSSPIGKFLARRGPGIHHICFSVDDLDGTLARCRESGIELIDDAPRLGAEGKRIAFLHPRSTGGILVELSEH
ncbi:MAG: methylmalonyl-CoA epimerase [Gemmatimonadota bacterium]|nr:methylmalonyl-CoA epimerase [Gemmatimonadota bacterium]